MLKIRMQRVGRVHEPVFRLVLTDSRNGPKSGKFLEILGSYDSRHSDKTEVKTDRVSHWMSHGVQLSPTVHNILVDKGIIKGKKISVLPKNIIEKAKNKKMSDEQKNVVEVEEKAVETPAEVEEEAVPAVEPEAVVEEVATEPTE